MTSTTSLKANLAEYEKRERDLTTALFNNFKSIKTYSFTSGKTFYDGIAVSQDDRKAIFEIKVREFGMHQYPNYFLEVAKFKNLYGAAERTGHNLLYINYFRTADPEKWDYIVFNLTKRIAEWRINGSPKAERIRMNAKTFVSRTAKIYKDIFRLEYDPEKDKTGTVYFGIN